jgi:hypothetical protein
MSGFYLRGALVEYGSDVLGPLPNIVIFQFNPEQIARTLNIARPRSSVQQESKQREPRQTSGPPTETFNITAHFSAADDLGKGGTAAAVPKVFGIGPQLAALEKMVYPAGGIISGAIGAAVDAVGDAIDSAGSSSDATQPVPREQVPRILFIWGPSRVLPVEIQSMSITEQKFDSLLNPVQAEVQVGLAVATYPSSSRKPQIPVDPVGVGALAYTQAIKDSQAALNLTKAAEFAADIISF